MRKIDKNETELHGKWIFNKNKQEKDDISKRIETLINSYLILITVDQSGWYKLYRDPEDGRYWELSYPESEMQGGGAPSLKNISEGEMRKKYI